MRDVFLKDEQTRAQQRAAGTNNITLFDIVNAAAGDGSLRAPRGRAYVSRASDPGLDPGKRRPGTQELHGKIDGY